MGFPVQFIFEVYFQCSRAVDLARESLNWLDMIKSQQLCSSFKHIISSTFSSLMSTILEVFIKLALPYSLLCLH